MGRSSLGRLVRILGLCGGVVVLELAEVLLRRAAVGVGAGVVGAAGCGPGGTSAKPIGSPGTSVLMSCSDASGGAATTKYCTVPSAMRTATRFSAEAGIVSAVAKAAARTASRQRVWIVRFISWDGTLPKCVSAGAHRA